MSLSFFKANQRILLFISNWKEQLLHQFFLKTKSLKSRLKFKIIHQETQQTLFIEKQDAIKSYHIHIKNTLEGVRTHINQLKNV